MKAKIITLDTTLYDVIYSVEGSLSAELTEDVTEDWEVGNFSNKENAKEWIKKANIWINDNCILNSYHTNHINYIDDPCLTTHYNYYDFITEIQYKIFCINLIA